LWIANSPVLAAALERSNSMTRIRGFPLRQMRDEMDQVMQGLFGRLPRDDWEQSRAFPAMNVWEQGDEVFVEAELPGLKSNDLEISVVADELTIKGARKDEATDGTTWHRRERGVGPFSRVLKLPVEVDADKVRASLRDGVLLITLAKSPAARPRRIEVVGGK
jgi:HSP20 family protein